jgi:hypothetical protein
MKPFSYDKRTIGTSPVWEADLNTLVGFWLKKTENQGVSKQFHRDEVVQKVVQRAEKIRQFSQLPTIGLMDSPRKWETNWNREQAWGRLLKALSAFDWSVRIVTERMSGRALAANQFAGDDVILIEKWAVEQRVSSLQEAGLLIPFGWEDGVVLTLAEEVYEVLSEEVGHRPAQDWVDELGRHEFVQRVLGLPFTPWVVRFIVD